MKRCIGAALILTSLVALSGCAHAETNGGASTLAVESENTTPGFPDLRSVPTTSRANTDQNHWNGVAADVTAAATAMRANPRAAFGPPAEDPAAFLEQARQDLTATRDSH